MFFCSFYHRMLLLLQLATDDSGDTQALSIGVLQYINSRDGPVMHARAGQPVGVQNAQLQDFVLSGIQQKAVTYDNIGKVDQLLSELTDVVQKAFMMYFQQ